MLSSNSVASRDSRDSFNDLNSSILSNDGGELSRPKMSPRSAKPPRSGGRRIINNLDSLTKPKERGVETSTIKITDSTTMEELDHILEEDALKLINMKKDVFSAQQDELAKLKASVMNVKKEYDTLRAMNSYKEKSLQAVSDKKTNLSELDRSDSANNTAGHHVLNTLRQQTSEIFLQLTEEQRTSKMLTLMIKRLDDEIGQCRIEIAQLTVQTDQAKHDAAATQGSLMALRQELLEQENHLAKINSTLKTRKEERSNKINVLQTMSVEGGNSFMRIQQTLHDNSKRLEDRQRKREMLLHPVAPRREAWRRLVDTHGEREDEFSHLTDPNVAKRLNIGMIRDMVQRYASHSARMERLKQLDQELKSSIVVQQKKKTEFSDHLTRTLYRIQQLASSRQVYQEVDLKDFALASTVKECDDCKERDFRLRLSIESLKQSIPRFLSKVTKETYTLPSEMQLPAAIMELVDELTKLIKAIAPTLLKDATPDDLALMSMPSNNSSSNSGGSDSQSEFDRLQRLPGYSRLQKQLFYNLMTAKPDNSVYNIRIDAVGKVKAPKSTTGPAALYEDPTVSPVKQKRLVAIYKPHATQNSVSDDSQSSRTLDGELDPKHPSEQPTLGRKTIKSISRLIYDRDHNKFSKQLSSDKKR